MAIGDKNYNFQDMEQQHRSTYQPDNNTHRVDAVNATTNDVNYTYNVDGSLATIQYLYDSEFEVTNILTVADVAGSLDGKSMSIYSAKDALQYIIWYKVGIGTPAPADTATVKYIEVSIFSGDPSQVVAAATYNAILAHATAPTDFTTQILSSTLDITTALRGATTDSADIDTGFTINTTTQGVTDVVDTARFTYDANGNITNIVTDSGENIFNEPVKNIRNLNRLRDNISIQDANGDELAINADGSINVILSGDVAGVEIVDYQTSAAVSNGATVTHDYVVSGAVTFVGEELIASASSRMKVVVELETAAASGVFNTIFVSFNSSSVPTIRIPLGKMVKQVTGAIVRISQTNLDNSAQDLYSTLTGSEV